MRTNKEISESDEIAMFQVVDFYDTPWVLPSSYSLASHLHDRVASDHSKGEASDKIKFTFFLFAMRMMMMMMMMTRRKWEAVHVDFVLCNLLQYRYFEVGTFFCSKSVSFRDTSKIGPQNQKIIKKSPSFYLAVESTTRK